MSPYPSPSSAVPSAISTATSSKSTISTDGRLRTVIVVLSILAAILVAYIIYTTLKTKRRQMRSEHAGPYQGTVIQSDHPAAEIAPFGSNSYSGATGPKFSVFSVLVLLFSPDVSV